MKQSFVIELKIGEFIDLSSDSVDPALSYLDFRVVVENFLEERIGGLLCIDDCHIPQLRFIENGHQKCRLEIACCCERQCLVVENRLNEILM